MPANPDPLTTADWEAIRSGLLYTWGLAAGGVAAALLLLLGHGVLPSLLTTRDLPARLGRARPPLYALGLAAAAGAVYALVQLAVIYAGLFGRLYPRFAI
jgi:hypothetical protein